MKTRWIPLFAAAALAAAAGCWRADRATPEEQRSAIRKLQQERETLRRSVDELLSKDPRLEGMPATSVRVGVPTGLVEQLTGKLMGGFADQVTLRLQDLEVRKSGTVKKMVTLGEYELHVNIDEVTGRLRTGKPDLRFGGNQVSLRLPVTVASGSGRATISFRWDGKSVGGAVCGDLEITREVSGSVKPDTYAVQGGILLEATESRILATPRIPKLTINLKVEPSKESWDALRAVIAEKEGLCGYVLEKVDVMAVVKGIVDRGFNVALPTEKLKPVAVPVSVEPSMEVRGRRIALGVKLGGLAITERTIWLGADVSVSSGSGEPALVGGH
jgi:hypothetical protein